MDTTPAFIHVNIKEEHLDDETEENTKKNIIYLPMSNETFKAENPVDTDDVLRNKIKTEYESEEKQELSRTVADDFFHVNIKTESYDTDDIEDERNYYSEDLVLTESEIETCGKSLVVDGTQAERSIDDGDDRRQTKVKKPYADYINVKCASCGNLFSSRHENKFICDVCGERFVQESSRNVHNSAICLERSSLDEQRPSQSGVCFTRTTKVDPSNVTYTKPEQYSCKICQATFIDYASFEDHLFVHTQIETRKCLVCNKKFLRDKAFKRHMYIHGIKSYECNVCNRKFNRSDNLKEHMYTHSEIKPYECTVCPKKFLRSSNLNEHMLIHTGVKPHECIVCEKKFTHSSSLKTHVLTHSGLKPFECDICPKKFRDNRSLTRHRLTHFDVRPYECNICQKKFTQSGSLKAHLLIHSGDQPHACNVCQKKFRLPNHLKRHSLIHLKPNHTSEALNVVE